MSKGRKHHHEEHVDESWLIPYADILTLLLALFIVLYSMSAVDAKKFEAMSRAFNVAFSGSTGILDNSSIVQTGDGSGKKNEDKVNEGDSTKKDTTANSITSKADQERMEGMKQEQENMEKIKKQLDTYIKDNKLTTQLSSKLNQSELLITISDTALFASGSATVRPESRNLAVALSDILTEFPGYQIVVTGHTDNQPISTAQFQSNWELSSARASKFMKILLQNSKLDPKTFSVVGQGEYHPIATNSTSVGRAQNRRVEISIVRKFIDEGNTQKVTVTKP